MRNGARSPPSCRIFDGKRLAMRTEICITIDTEFSIAGAFTDPTRFAPVGERLVECDIDGREHGLGFLLEVFERYGIAATFFVEALNTCYFGDATMAGIAQRIVAAGHDAQLHLHPCWLAFRDPAWRDRVAVALSPPSDSCAGRALGEIEGIIAEGIEIFQRWGLPRPIALRTGGLIVDRTVYRGMARQGLRIGSNLGLAISCPSDAGLQFAGGRHWIEGVLELPVLTYRQPTFGVGARQRNLTITASSAREVRSLLWQAHDAGISPIVVLTHPFEFIKHQGSAYERLRPDRVNQERLIELCRFINENEDCFSTARFSDGMDRWLTAGESADPEFAVSAGATAIRMAENYLNTKLWRY